MAGEADAPALDVRARGEQVERRSVSFDLRADMGRVRFSVGRWRRPRERALRQQRDDTMLAREAHRLVEELAAVAVRGLGVEPVQEEDRGAAAPVDRLDEVGLGAADVDVVDARAVPLDGGL